MRVPAHNEVRSCHGLKRAQRPPRPYARNHDLSVHELHSEVDQVTYPNAT